MSKEAKKEPNEQVSLESQQENEMSEQHTSEEKTMNITQYLSLYADKYESDMVLFFQNKFKMQVHSETEWENIIAAFLEKTVV